MGAGCVLLALCVLLASGAGAGWLYLRGRGPALVGAPTVEYVLDASPRMRQPSAAGGTRLNEAQGVLAEILRPASPAVTAGLRVFGAGQLSGACQDTSLLVPLAPASQAKISDRLATLPGGAGVDAALGVALVAAIRDLAATRGPHTLVVVTGGPDSCNPQAGQLIAQEAGRQHIQLQLFVVGYQVSDADGVAIKDVVDQTSGGAYIAAHTVVELRRTLAAIQTYVDKPTGSSVAGVVATAGASVPAGTAAAGLTPAAGPTPTATNTGVLQLGVAALAGQLADANGRLVVQAFSPQDHQTILATEYANPMALRLPAGTYDLRLSYLVVNASPYIGGYDVQWATGLTVQAGLTTTASYDLKLGEVTLTVREAAGQPVPDGNYGFGFRIYPAADLNTATAWVIVTSTATLQLAPGQYVLRPDYPGTELAKQDPRAFAFEVKAGESLADFFNLKLGHLLVEVDDAVGQPLAPARLSVANATEASQSDRPFAFAYSANPADLPLQAGVTYTVVVTLDNGRRLTLANQQVGEGETRTVPVSASDFK